MNRLEFVRILRLGLVCVAAHLVHAADPLVVWREGPQAGHYFAWQGRPLFLIGDSITQGWMECGTNFDQRAYVEALARRGINLLMLWSYKGTSAELQRNDRRIGYDAPELWPWMGSPDRRSFDLTRFNPLYFERLRELVRYAERKGIMVLITVHDGWPKTCFEGHPFNRALGNGPLADRRHYVELADYDREMPEAFDESWSWQQRNQHFQERFCARLIDALKPFSNVLYEMFNEGEWYDREQRRRHEQHFLAFFRTRGRNVLVTNSDHLTGDGPHRDPKVDAVSLHPQGWVGQSGKFEAGFRATPPKPYVYSEPVPEFDGTTPALDQIRRSVWETALAGASWVNQNDSSFGWDRRTTAARWSRPRDAAYAIAGHCARFFNRSGVWFWTLEPRGDLASTGICLARPGEEYVVYAPAPGALAVDLSDTAGRLLAVRWFNPQTGKLSRNTLLPGGSPQQRFSPPFAGDAVLHLRAK